MKIIVKIIAILFLTMTSVVLAEGNNLIEKERYIKVPGGKIWYKIVFFEKSKNKTPLLVIHGGPGVPHDYLEVLSKLAKERPIIFYDQLGVGHSKISNANTDLWNLNRYVSELEILIDHLKYNKINLFGHSWGGALAVEYALKHPEKIKSLTLASPLLSSRIWVADTRQLINELPLNIQKIISTHEKKSTVNSTEFKYAMDVFYKHFSFRSKKLPKKLKYSFDHINFDIYKTMWGISEFSVTGNLKDYDRINDLQKLSMPVLLTCGKFDEATPKTLKKAITLLQRGKLIIYENSAHFAFLSEEKIYLRNLKTFLSSVDKEH